MDKPARVLIVEDSPFAVRALAAIIDADRGLELAGVATDGVQAIDMVRRLGPDIVTMDVHLPVMSGLAAIEKIMAYYPTPIVVITADSGVDTGDLSFEALRRGALDIISKSDVFSGAGNGARDFCQHLKFLASVPVVRHVQGSRGENRTRWQPQPGFDLEYMPPPRTGVLGVVGSTGGPAALATILRGLPGDFPLPMGIVQHLAPGFAATLAAWLDGVSTLTVCLAEDGLEALAGSAVIAPDGRHLVLDRDHRWRLDDSEPVLGHIPSGTALLRSVAEHCGPRAVGLILSGMGDDGVEGMHEIARRGGATLAQDEETSVVYGMAKRASELGSVDTEIPVCDIPGYLCKLVRVPLLSSGSFDPEELP